MGLLSKIFGTRSSRELKKIQPLVNKILALEEPYSKLSEAELRGKTAQFKARLAQGETLDDLLPEAFAAIREASDRVLGMKPYPVQLIGGIVLHQGRIAEMKTGEGKTLVAILPCYLNALTGKGVHVVTVNDYLAKYQSEWMGKVYKYMGLTVGLVIPSMNPAQRQQSYAADITYCTNNELGFDYLRDNMATYKQELVQRGHAFAIVDEVDSILIDEARTPLIISGKGENSSKLYEMADAFVSTLRKKVFAKTEDKEVQDNYDCDYFVDEKSRTVSLTAEGIAKAEKFFNVENLSDPQNGTISHHINQAMKARGLMKRDKDYVIKDGEIIIVDEFTGRLMYGRRYNEGLHQAIEAKEKVNVAGESKTLATITFQNFFRLYDKLSGMTGTALTEEAEFEAIYQLDVVEIPTNRPVIRKDHPDAIYRTEEEKLRAIVKQVKECNAMGQPVLVGTVSIEKSETLSKLLKKEGIAHHVLNAKYHEQEAQIVAQAGKLGAVTIATNMAGRGTDIMLGGNPEFLAKSELRKQDLPEELLAEADSHAETRDPEILSVRAKYTELLKQFKTQIASEAERVRAAGGLFIIGTERHESRRIDNQLRGRSGRQGDPGESRFYLSLQDDLMRLFSPERVMGMLEMAGMTEDQPIESKMVTSAVETAQKSVEGRHFRARKNVLEYDNVMNTQREIIYAQRQKVLDGENLRENILSMLRSTVDSVVMDALAQYETVNAQLIKEITTHIGYCMPKGLQLPDDPDKLADAIYEAAVAMYEKKEEMFGQESARELERVMLLRAVDENWMEHIDDMDDLKQGIGLQAYGQHDPVVAFKEEGFLMFENMIGTIREQTVRGVFTFVLRPAQELRRERVAKETGTGAASQATVKQQPIRNRDKKVGPNDECPCGSKKKYKKCCMQKDKLKNFSAE
ncbi:MAG: preprotein translocase subunit SecA [Ruminococcaceae bacterium]|nr:preprotein translocase subunit SecA [Oscillospiraceae bacterium]